MKQILAIAFAVSSLLRPGFVLCVESGGDVRVERPTAICCESEPQRSSLGIDAADQDDCAGCLDFSLVTHSLKSKRTTVADMETACMTLPTFKTDVIGASMFSPFAPDRPLTYFSTTTTVIRR